RLHAGRARQPQRRVLHLRDDLLPLPGGPRARRTRLARRGMKRPGLLLGLHGLAVAGILGCLVALAARHPWRLDLTPDRRFTLTAHTRAVLAALPLPVSITYFYAADDQVTRREVEALLRLYADASARVRVHSRDLDRSPGE